MASDGALLLAPGKPRTLAFQHSARKDLRLLELDEGLLQELLGSGLNIKGEEGEEAVLCTQSQTLAIKTVETTNSVWLVQPDQGGPEGEGEEEEGCLQLSGEVQSTPPGQLVGLATQLQRNKGAAARPPVLVTAVASSHLELMPAAPRLHKLDALLQELLYGVEGMDVDGTEEGSGHCSGRYTRTELLQRVQASPAELDRALEERHALCLDGQYCSVDPEYLGTLLEMLLLTAIEQGWAQEHVIPEHAAADALAHSGYDPRLVRHCLKVYGSRVAEESGGSEEPCTRDSGGSCSISCSSGGGAGVWRLSERQVCRHFARKLLACQPQWPLEEFLEAWRGSVPEAMLPDLEMLRGEALVWGQAVKRFPVEALPADAAGRFAALFSERERWVWEDMAPYVEGLQGPGQTVEGLLLRYTRATQPRPSDPLMYSAR